ncbi:hypothetical protein J6590_083933 [Homalodisca vitripennis]|nr:hypothetical protein J6590_083933 [Homalodisca vitripennis]
MAGQLATGISLRAGKLGAGVNQPESVVRMRKPGFGENIMKSWGTIRDGFMRSLKPKTETKRKEEVLVQRASKFLVKNSTKRGCYKQLFYDKR